jgi:uncharacterized protein YeaO (DUF488 family)
MKFSTSNYEKNSANPLAVAISHPRDVPAEYTGAKNADLAPTEAMLEEYHERKVSHDEYAAEYVKLLGTRGITPQSLTEQYPDGAVFLCFDYEDGDISICHRVILAEWLTAAGFATSEI